MLLSTVYYLYYFSFLSFLSILVKQLIHYLLNVYFSDICILFQNEILYIQLRIELKQRVNDSDATMMFTIHFALLQCIVKAKAMNFFQYIINLFLYKINTIMTIFSLKYSIIIWFGQENDIFTQNTFKTSYK